MSFKGDTDVQHSSTESWNSGGTAGILDTERAKASFDVETLTNFMDGGKKNTQNRRFIMSSTEDLEDIGSSSKKHDTAREGKGGSIAKNFTHFMEIHDEYLKKGRTPKGQEMMYMYMGATMGGYPGFGLFLSTISGQSSDEQLGWWLPKCYTMQITGSYAQTELGHGSNVRGLRTTAIYDKSTQEFVLETPTLSSMKWWPSSLATSTHAVVYAQLIIEGVEYGVHVFMVQLRDENLEPLSGIEVGDIGTKMGENEVDIGYLRLSKVRIPRKHMFEKQQHVTPDGCYIKHGGKSGNPKAAYLTMMGARVTMVGGSSVYLSKAATIAIRYNAVRKQGFANTKAGASYLSEESQIIDYKMNQFRLLKELALSYAIRITSNWMNSRMADLRSNINNESATKDLPEVHASAAGLKGFCCNAAAVGIEELRKCCGGAGYLMASGIAAIEADYKWRATAEGDTTVMLLQTARYLLKSAQDAKQGKELSGLCACLAPFKQVNYNPIKDSKPTRVTSSDNFLSLDYLLALYEYRATSQVFFLEQAMAQRTKGGETHDEAWTNLTLKACRTGQSHVLYFMLAKFKEMCATCEDQPCRAVLERLCALFALADMVTGQQWAGLLDIDQVELVEEACSRVCSMLRPDAVALVDAWDYPDHALNSTIGGRDGDVYEKQYLAAVDSPLNDKRVPDYFEAIKPFLDLEFLALRNNTHPMYTGQDEYPEGTDMTKGASKL